MATRQYIGARYVPKFSEPIEWDKNRGYEALEIVTYLGTSYTSKKTVPVGTEIDNEEFWVVTGNYNAQVEQYRKDTLAYKKEVEEYILYKTVESFGAVGDGKTDDTTAIKTALEYGKNNNVTITTKGKKYAITENLSVDQCVFDLNNGELFGGYSVTVTNGGRLTNGCLNGLNLILTIGKNNADYLTIKEWVGTAILLRNTYECFLHHIRLENNSKGNTVGIDFEANDCTVDYLYGYGARIGIINNGGDNYVYNAHLWLNSNNNFDGSVFCKQSVTTLKLIGCCCDSYETMLLQTVNTINTEFIGCRFINNNTLFHDKTFYLISGGSPTLLRGDITCKLTGFANSNNTFYVGESGKITLTVIDGEASDYKETIGTHLKNEVSVPCTTNNETRASSVGGNISVTLALWFDPLVKSFSVNLTTLLSAKDKNVSGVTWANASGEKVLVSYTLKGGTLTVSLIDETKNISSILFSLFC